MIHPPTSASNDERRLIKCFRTLATGDRATLLAFADFLAERTRREVDEEPMREPQSIPRPDRESVVGAIKRLSRTYEMLERDALLHETSALMSAHVLQGRPANLVIDELEALFDRHYQDYRTRLGAPDA